MLLLFRRQPIDYEGFRRFMDFYLDSADMPDDLCRHLFLSFLKRPPSVRPQSDDVGPNDDASGQAGDLTPIGGGQQQQQPGSVWDSPSRLHGLAEKLHGLTERLQQSITGNGGSSNFDLPGRRSRAGRYKRRPR